MSGEWILGMFFGASIFWLGLNLLTLLRSILRRSHMQKMYTEMGMLLLENENLTRALQKIVNGPRKPCSVDEIHRCHRIAQECLDEEQRCSFQKAGGVQRVDVTATGQYVEASTDHPQLQDDALHRKKT